MSSDTEEKTIIIERKRIRIYKNAAKAGDKLGVIPVISFGSCEGYKWSFAK